jgi:long-chain acyl-CoA synthetase
VFSAAQIPAMEGYGLTETSPVIAVNQVDPDNNLLGTVGPIIEGIEVKISDKGEILTRGPHVMKGYYNKPEATAETIDSEGWLHTGDKGAFVNGKFLKITGRIKEIFKTSGGKYISPVALENKFSESKVIEQILVIGENRKFPAALIVPSFDGLKEWCKIKGIDYSTDDEMIKDEKIIAKFNHECDKYNASFANYERLKKVELILKPWTIESGELTPTMKPKRRIVLANNAELIEEMYDC